MPSEITLAEFLSSWAALTEGLPDDLRDALRELNRRYGPSPGRPDGADAAKCEADEKFHADIEDIRQLMRKAKEAGIDHPLIRLWDAAPRLGKGQRAPLSDPDLARAMVQEMHHRHARGETWDALAPEFGYSSRQGAQQFYRDHKYLLS